MRDRRCPDWQLRARENLLHAADVLRWRGCNAPRRPKNRGVRRTGPSAGESHKSHSDLEADRKPLQKPKDLPRRGKTKPSRRAWGLRRFLRALRLRLIYFLSSLTHTHFFAQWDGIML